METLISTLLYIYPCNVNSDDFIFLLFNDLSREHLTTLDITHEQGAARNMLRIVM